jgi:outer membrane protein TolC
MLYFTLADGLRPPRMARAALLVLLIAAGGAGASEQDPPHAVTVEDLLSAARRLSPSLRASALETAAAAARAEGADALDDPTLTDNYQFYRDPGTFSGHALMVSQAFPLWGKRDLRREAALSELDVARGREQAARDDLEERVKVAFARLVMADRAIGVNREVAALAHGMKDAAGARYGAGRGDQPAILQAITQETAAKEEIVRLEGERAAAWSMLAALTAQPPATPIPASVEPRPLPGAPCEVGRLLDDARAHNPALMANGAEVSAAERRSALADKAWYPDITVGAGPLIQTNNRPPGFTATIGINLPLGWGREESEQKAAQARLGAARERQDAVLYDIQAALGEAVARLDAARRSAALIDEEAQPEMSAMLRSAMAAYGQGAGSFATAVDAMHHLHDLRIKRLQIDLDEQIALAAIERLIGGKL